jgi:hypothetical protein
LLPAGFLEQYLHLPPTALRLAYGDHPANMPTTAVQHAPAKGLVHEFPIAATLLNVPSCPIRRIQGVAALLGQ